MAWLAVDEDGQEVVFEFKPLRDCGFWRDVDKYYPDNVPLPKGSIQKLISKELTWEDEPIELK